MRFLSLASVVGADQTARRPPASAARTVADRGVGFGVAVSCAAILLSADQIAQTSRLHRRTAESGAAGGIQDAPEIARRDIRRCGGRAVIFHLHQVRIVILRPDVIARLQFVPSAGDTAQVMRSSPSFGGFGMSYLLLAPARPLTVSGSCEATPARHRPAPSVVQDAPSSSLSTKRRSRQATAAFNPLRRAISLKRVRSGVSAHSIWTQASSPDSSATCMPMMS